MLTSISKVAIKDIDESDNHAKLDLVCIRHLFIPYYHPTISPIEHAYSSVLSSTSRKDAYYAKVFLISN